jgi:hypothetical protein
MSTIVLRSVKGTPLTNTEVDTNFSNLNTDKYQSGDAAAFTTLSATGVTTVQAGTALLPAITTTGDTNTGIFFPAADTIAFSEGGAEAMRIDSSGNVGIGTGSPSSFGSTQKILAVQGSSGSVAGYIAAVSSDATRSVGMYSGLSSSDTPSLIYVNALRFGSSTTTDGVTGYSEKMRIDSSGNVGIGTSSVTANMRLDVQAASSAMQVKSTTGTNVAFTQYVNTGGTFYVGIDSSVGGGLTGSSSAYSGVISHSGAYPLSFGTSSTERMRITSAGGVSFGATGTAYGTSGQVLTSAGNAPPTWTTAASANTASAIVQRDASGNFTAGTITAALTGNASGSAATFTSTSQNSQFNSVGVGTAGSGTAGEIRATNNITAYYSDDRLKTRLGNIQDALAKVKTLSGFYYEANQTAQDLGYDVVREVGVSAQQVQAVLPEIVVPAPIDEKYWTVRYEKMIPLLIEAIKELEVRLAALESKK